MKSVPDVALVGAMKAGTTTLANIMSGHPRLAVANANQPGTIRKEPGYFSRDDRYAKGPDWYESHFAHALDGQLTVDASTCYSRSRQFPHAMHRLHRANRRAKLIYILRHPVERTYSHYLQYARQAYFRGDNVLTIGEYLQEDATVIAASFYDDEIQHVLRHFGPDSLLCLRFEDLQTKPRVVLERISRHLDIEPFQLDESMPSLNSHDKSIERLAESEAMNRLLKSPLAQAIKPLLPELLRRHARNSFRRLVVGNQVGRRATKDIQGHASPLDSETRHLLHEVLDPHTLRLGDILQWDVSNWTLNTNPGGEADPLVESSTVR
ncbi:Sulfotransferase domain protein [Pirellulimonas nuda]|uniref:Sulfotransferase domain protein n=1 Tax=Pirellulimonas nuda TaxID=2528009 RepID=A0A518DCX4_9BACT|nr:sulfotransferase [Pirellulimonas nuda]QDU89334.1 Sulfotransferase domain protein [Pirellulimonas nuda]